MLDVRHNAFLQTTTHYPYPYYRTEPYPNPEKLPTGISSNIIYLWIHIRTPLVNKLVNGHY